MGQVTNNSELKNIVGNIVKDMPSVQSVYFVGCGASRSDLYPAFYFLNREAKRIRTSIHTAREFNLATPTAVNETAVVITCSLSGNTPETAEATKTAKEHGARVIAVTHGAGSDITKGADAVVIFDWSENYSSKQDKMMKVILLAAEILNQSEGYENYGKLYSSSEKIYPAIDEAVRHVGPEAEKFAREYKDAPIVYVTSSGAMQELAWSFSSCLMMEMQWIPASTFNDGDFFHGPFEMVEKNVPYLLFMNDGSTRPMDARAMTFMQRFDALTTVVDAKDYGLAGIVEKEVLDYFNPVLLGAVIRVYAEHIAALRSHPLTKRRYMWKLDY